MTDRQQDSGGELNERSATPALEWFSAALGLLLTLAILGFIGREAIKGFSVTPPAIEVSVERITPIPAGFVVEVAAKNRSDATAAAVHVEGVLRAGGRSIETSQATISYVPGRSERRAGLFFTRDPRGAELSVRPTGYEEP